MIYFLIVGNHGFCNSCSLVFKYHHIHYVVSIKFLGLANPWVIDVKVISDIYLVGGGEYGLSPVGDWCNVYLIDGGDELALIDSGSGLGVSRIIENIVSEGFDPRRIRYLFLTHSHFDHVGGAYFIQKLTNCLVLIHENEADALEKLGEETLIKYSNIGKISPPKVNVRLKGGEEFRVGRHVLRVIHTPGHTSGSICIFMEVDGRKVLFTGDTVFARGRIGWFNTPGSDLNDYRKSLRRLLDLRPDVILPGHGTFVLHNAFEHVKLLLDKLNVPWKFVITILD